MSKKRQTTIKPELTAGDEGGGNMRPFYRVEQAAGALGLAEATVRKYYNLGLIRGYKKAGRIYFLHRDLLDFITGGANEPMQ